MSQTSAINKRELTRRCKRAGLSVRALAREVTASGTSLTHAAVSRWLNGAANPSDGKLAAVADRLGCEPGDLLLRGRRP
jgi:transcriptional regulator with XRE-family HTH domain